MTPLRIMRSLLCTSLLFVAMPFYGATPSKFTSVPAMMSSLNDYAQENGTFKVLRREPLHIQVSPMVVPGDFPDVIDAEVKRAVIYGIYRSFIHTSVGKITVTAIPKELNLRTKSSRYLGAYKRTVTKTRREALDLVRHYLHVATFDALVEDQRIGGSVVSDMWTMVFNKLYYEDQGPPGLMTFYNELER